jgi:hypothetical protein
MKMKVFKVTFTALVFAEDEEHISEVMAQMWDEGDFDNITDINDWHIEEIGEEEI